jgi:predicted DNA-binding protein (MmcQ/YjbR family)
MPASPLVRVRKICLALPEAHEKIAWGESTFRVRDRMFVMFANNHHGDGRIAIWCKAAPGAQEDLVAANPKHFFVPPYVGKAGWLGVRLDKKLDWGIVAGLVRDGYLEVAPKRLRSGLEPV